MASPQTENGYTRLANELLEQLPLRTFSAGERCVLDVVFRCTYGWGKSWDRISLSQFQKRTGLTRSGVCKTIKSLVSSRTLLKGEKGYSFNKNWEQWLVSHRTPSIPQDTGVVSPRTPKVVSPRTPTKERKETIKRNTSARSRARDPAEVEIEPSPPQAKPSEPPTDSTLHQQIVAIFDVFRDSVNDSIQYGHRTNRAAAETLIKKYGAAEAVKVAQFACSVQGQKYAPVITTPHELLMKLAALGIYAKRENGKKPRVTIIS